MEVELRYADLDRDYLTLSSWCQARGLAPPIRRFMPPTGLIALVEGVEVCAGFLFKSDANAAILGDIIANPKATGEMRDAALTSIIDALAAIAKSQGFGMICCSTKIPKLLERFKHHEFSVSEDGMTHLGRMF